MEWLQYLASLEQFGIKAGLENIRLLCAALDNPQVRYPSVLIAGTNGKGSVTAMVERALRAAGVRTGRYTSPHLLRLEERFAVAGEPVDTAALAGAIDRVRAAADALLADGSLQAPPTFFDVTTAAAFELFRRAGVEFAVLEVGIGGRLDSTNVVDAVAVAITSIALDHEQYLGDTLAAIAAEKAGVIRTGIPVVVGPMHADAREVIAAHCTAAHAELVDATEDVEIRTHVEGGRTFLSLRTAMRDYGELVLGLRGEHQAPNAVVAARLLECLERRLPIGPEAIIAGLQDVRWPGRLDMVESGSGQRVLLDAAHNPAGASALASYLRREFPERLPLVFGAMRDKDAPRMLQALLPCASRLVMTQPHSARSRSADELATIARELSPDCPVDIRHQPSEALALAWRHNPIVCAAGSIFLVGDILASLGHPAPHG